MQRSPLVQNIKLEGINNNTVRYTDLVNKNYLAYYKQKRIQ